MTASFYPSTMLMLDGEHMVVLMVSDVIRPRAVASDLFGWLGGTVYEMPGFTLCPVGVSCSPQFRSVETFKGV